MLWLLLAALDAAELGEGSTDLTGPMTPSAQVVTLTNLDDPVRVDDVEVRGRRGAARLAPETELNGAEIDALGAYDIGEVLDRIGETLGVGDEPMVIINGKRVANSSVFSGFPPDALVRAEVLPPEAGGLYGGKPGQRVVNLVLQRRFSSHDARMIGSRPTQGGTSSLSADLRRSAIAGDKTHQSGVRVSRDSPLRADERERGHENEGPGAGAITLRPRSDAVSANVNLTHSLGQWAGVFSLSGQARESRPVSRLGANIVEGRRQYENLGVSAGLSGTALGWSVQGNMNGQASRSRDEGFADIRNENQSLGFNGTAGRTLMEWPSGAVVANLGGNFLGTRSVLDRNQARTTTTFHTGEVRGSLSVPLSKAGEEQGKWSGLGDVLATLGGSVRQSSAGGGDEVNAAFAWTPNKGVRLNGVWSASSDSVPDLQRFEPVYFDTPMVVFDFRTGEAVEIAPIRGGNPDLRPPHTESLSLTASIGPFSRWSLAGNLGYLRTESTDGIGALPDLTEDVEAAFPDRFQRDATGRLISIDFRPMNLGSTQTEGLTSSLNFNLPRPAGVAANEATVVRVALNYNLRLGSTLSLASGLPELDRLKGDGGGVSRQDARAMLDARRGRWGVNASARWEEGYRTRRFSGQDGSGDLITAPYTAVDLKLSFQMTSTSVRAANADEEGGARRRSAGLQLSLEVSNLFDARPEARLGDGAPAPGYGRDWQDPIGRSVRLSLQRRF
ncbi:TonB-dependent receptor [Brevundimonas sp. NPDC090276]|uniref:TonB-dependent receptor n=1 Tax=Brevundimonas sp. NPDC090276 TaxID=3363956 RepID=UPI00383B777E